MKKSLSHFLHIVFALVVVFACTKDVGLVTEVEFSLTEQHEQEGYVNVALPTTVTVTPEAELEGYEYFITYSVSNGEGHYEDGEGNILPAGEKIALSPLSTSIHYVGSTVGEHQVHITAEDSFGFTEEIALSYTLTEVPVTWTATSPITQIELNKTAPITVTFDTGALVSAATYERNYKITTGSGSLNALSTEEVAPDGYTPIVPGTHQFVFAPDALGVVVIEFHLRDSNGQELLTKLEFEVVAQIVVASKDITALSINGVSGTINNTDITIVLPSGTPITALEPVIAHTGASVSPDSGTAQDFTNPVTYTVTASDNTTKTYTVTVAIEEVTGITVSPTTATVTVGGTQQLTAAVIPSNSSNQGVNWTSSDPSIATVDVNGLVTTIAVGEVTITVMSNGNGNITATSVITVTTAAFPVTGITVSPATATVSVGATQPLTATVTPSNANQSVVWSSSDTSIATVDTNGLVTTVSAGTATITATSGSDATKFGSSTITVTAAQSSTKDITAFSINSVAGVISGTDIAVTLPSGTDALALIPAITHNGASVSPVSGTAQNFTSPVSYTVTADDNSTKIYTVTVIVAAANQLPTANAGPDQTIRLPTSSVTLSGSGTDNDGSIVSYLWENLVPLQPATIASPNAASTNVSGLVPGTYGFRLTVTDNSGGTATDTVTLTVTNSAPIISFNKSTGLYIAPAGSAVTVTITTDDAQGGGSADLRIHTESNGLGTTELLSLGYVWLVPTGDSIVKNDSGTFTMPANEQVYFFGRHIDIGTNITRITNITGITIQNGIGSSISDFMASGSNIGSTNNLR